MLPTIGVPELLIILVIVLILFGVGRLAEVGKALGEGIRAFKSATNDSAKDGDRKQLSASEDVEDAVEARSKDRTERKG